MSPSRKLTKGLLHQLDLNLLKVLSCSQKNRKPCLLPNDWTWLSQQSAARYLDCASTLTMSFCSHSAWFKTDSKRSTLGRQLTSNYWRVIHRSRRFGWLWCRLSCCAYSNCDQQLFGVSLPAKFYLKLNKLAPNMVLASRTGAYNVKPAGEWRHWPWHQLQPQ